MRRRRLGAAPWNFEGAVRKVERHSVPPRAVDGSVARPLRTDYFLSIACLSMLLSITFAELFTAACACRACHSIIPAKSIAAASQVTTLAVNQILARSDRRVSPIAANLRELAVTPLCAALALTAGASA